MTEAKRLTTIFRRATALVWLVIFFGLPLAATAQQRIKNAAATSQTSAARRAPATPRAVPDALMIRIVRAEDERRWNASDLGALLANSRVAVRRRAVLAAGRIGDAGAIMPLARLLQNDPDQEVRAMAAFALGEIESMEGVAALLESLRTSKSTAVRARSIEALGKIAGALPEAQEARRQEIGEAILLALNVEHKLANPDREIILQGLTATLRARPRDASKTLVMFLASTDARVRADAANALARLRAKDAGDQLRARFTVHDADDVARANIVRALGAAEDKAAFDALLVRATRDEDERVRISAVRALASLKDARAAAPLLQRGDVLFSSYRTAKTARSNNDAAHPTEINELLEIATTLGRVLANSNDERAVAFMNALREAEDMSAPEIEIAFARAAPSRYVRQHSARSVQPSASLSPATTKSATGSGGEFPFRHWQSVSALAQGLGEIASTTSATGPGNAVTVTEAGVRSEALSLLRALLNNASTPALAMPDVLRAFAAFKPDDLSEVLRARFNADDVIVRATAAELLGEVAPDSTITKALAAALPRALKDEMNDAALAILDALAKQKNDDAATMIKSVLSAPDHLVRRRAVALLKVGNPPSTNDAQTVNTQNRPIDYTRALARAGSASVRAVVTTDKGAFTIELLSEDAPLTVDNFVMLARRKYFDSITFHRVVPNFVIQGGDPRGDGNGGPGYQIRCEINSVPYERGAVGMALSGKDTGGSQWFVTHSPQPHLDGGYTVFGRVVEGMEIVDRIARGDLIRSVRVVEGNAASRPARGAIKRERPRR